MLCVLAGALLAPPPPRPFSEERHLLDRRLETLRRILPDGPQASGDILHLRDLAEAASLSRVEVTARPHVESGRRGEVTLDLRALGSYGEVERFFGRVALSPRPVDVESLTLTATTESIIQLEAVLRFPFRPRDAPLPAPPEFARGRFAGVPRPTLDAFLRDQSLALAKSEAIAALRRTRRNPRLFLAELAATVRDRPVVLGYASLGEEFVVRGLAVGEGPVRALERRFERGFFRVAEFLMARQGACYRFETRGTSPVVGPEAELPVSADDPFEQEESPCRIDRDTARTVIVRGPTPTAKNPGRGPLTLRLRDVDLADVFQVLSLLTAAGFVVDGDATGRVSLELTRVTLEEALGAIARGAGIEIARQAPLRRVSRSRLEPRAGPSAGGVPASFALKRTEVRELLAVMADLDPALAALGPPGPLGRLSVWAKDVPLLELRAAVLEAAGLTERMEDDHRILERPTGAGEAPAPVARVAPERRLALRPEDLAVAEFEPAGVASNDTGWVAFAYSPTGRLFAYRPGDRLADGVVRTIESTDVMLDTEDGPARTGIPPLP